MNYAQYIKEIGRGQNGSRDLSREDAMHLYQAILDGGVPDLEMGAIILGLRVKGESPAEMLGFLEALESRTEMFCLPHGRVRPVILPSYNGARKEANLTPLLALVLQKFGVPVLVHGLLEGYGRVTSAQIFREFGVMPAANRLQVHAALDAQGLAFSPLNVFSPGLHRLLGLRGRLGLRNTAHSLVKMLDPFGGGSLLVAPATHPPYIDLMREVFTQRSARVLLMRGTEGEPYANPKRRPRLELVVDGRVETLFEAEHDSLRLLPNLPEATDAQTTAAWMRRVLDKQLPLPKPLADQIACILYGCGYADDFNQAKAVLAVALMA